MELTIYQTEEGSSHPLGATPYMKGVNFSIFSENATGIELLLFNKCEDCQPFQVINFDPLKNRSFSFWHVFVKELKPGVFYNYRVDGPYDLKQGLRFNRNKVLVDPYAKGTTDSLWDRDKACTDEDNLAASMRGVVINLDGYDWEGDQPLNIPMRDTIIYEMHVGGFTKSPSAKVNHPGTFVAIIEKIPYLKELGINAVELMPVFDFDNKEILRINSDSKALRNYWGYSTNGFFAPEKGYCVKPEVGLHLDEFRDMVKALHKEGIQVILDVVFNHTNEGNHQGPVINFKGFDNSIYYYLVNDDKQYYYDYTGCGNTFNCNHPISEKFILECLEYWVKEMHVDGFRFDEASVLSRGDDGTPVKYPPVLWSVELLDFLADTKLIAEAWDAGGLYQIGGFPGYRWAEWNGRYRDDIRRFIRGDGGLVGKVASRIAGSNDLYQHARHSPLNSINFICCHDGFTMMDLVSYNNKHNEANGEGNRDGINENLSSNYGAEGYTTDESINRFRIRQLKNMAAILLLSQGVPMILAGDEVGHSQQGNNNAYCQDNEISWLDWSLLEKNQEIFRFFKEMIGLRNNNAALRRGDFFRGEVNERGLKDITWHGCKLDTPEWDEPSSKVLSFTMGSFREQEPDIHVMINMDSVAYEFELPKTGGNKKWLRFADSSLTMPNDIQTAEFVPGNSYLVEYFSVVILLAN